MKIKIGKGKELIVFLSKGKVTLLLLSDYSGKINFRKEVKNFLKSEGKPVILKDIKSLKKHFAVFTEKSLNSLDALKLACSIRRKIADKQKTHTGRDCDPSKDRNCY